MERSDVERLVEVEERSKSNVKRLNDHENRIEELEKTYLVMQKMDYKIGCLEGTVNDISAKLDKRLEDKGKKWDKLIDYLFYFVLALLLGYIAMNLGLK